MAQRASGTQRHPSPGRAQRPLPAQRHSRASHLWGGVGIAPLVALLLVSCANPFPAPETAGSDETLPALQQFAQQQRTHESPSPVGSPFGVPSRSATETLEPPPAEPDPALALLPPLVDGVASWYCAVGRSSCTRGHPGGLFAAAGPALRVGDWQNRTVKVCAGSCVEVRLIDWCDCHGTRAIDLYSDAFRRLAPLSRGVLTVSVEWGQRT